MGRWERNDASDRHFKMKYPALLKGRVFHHQLVAESYQLLVISLLPVVAVGV